MNQQIDDMLNHIEQQLLVLDARLIGYVRQYVSKAKGDLADVLVELKYLAKYLGKSVNCSVA